MRSTAYISAETEKFMPEVSRVIENSNKKKLPTENTVSGKLFFKNKGELNIFPNKQSWRSSLLPEPLPQMLKGVLQVEIKGPKTVTQRR